MKASLFLTCIALSGAGVLGWQSHTRTEAAWERQRVLEKKAAAQGLPANGLSATASRPAPKPPDIDVNALVSKLLEAADAPEKQTDDLEKAGRELALLDEKGMRSFVASFRSSTAMDDAKKASMVLLLMKLALSERPRASLSLFDAFCSAGGKPEQGEAAKQIPDTLEMLATEDPALALEWLRTKGNVYHEFITGEVRMQVLMTAAASDPQQAFRAIGSIGIDEPQDAVCAIMRSGNSPAQRLATLAALREHLAGMPDERLKKERSQAAIIQLAQSAVLGGDAVARQWVAAAKFTPVEMDAFAEEISKKAVIPREIGGWVECLAAAGAETFPGQPVSKMVEYWTIQDYRAAGEWLLTTRDGPAKQAAIRGYAETVAKYEPEVAEQWAMTLPAGKDRDATLAKIHEKWPEGDRPGKTDFATRHGVR